MGDPKKEGISGERNSVFFIGHDMFRYSQRLLTPTLAANAHAPEMTIEEKMHFSKIKEDREKYFVEYSPPLSGFPFATLQLVFPAEVEAEDVAQFMEFEGKMWLERYPTPLMISAFDLTGDLIYLNGTRPENHYTAFLVPDTKKVIGYWRLLKNEEMPAFALNRNNLTSIYDGIPHRTPSELKVHAKNKILKYRLGWYVVFIWAVVAPGAFLVLEYFGPQWLATSVLLYGLYKAMQKALKMTGKWKKSAREHEKEENDRLMRHHHYHCLKNPEGFLKLKIENFEKEQQAYLRKEAQSLNINVK